MGEIMEPNKIHLIRYQKFIDSRKQRIIPENIYIEKHHIIPRSMGGNDLEENLIDLTAREHFIAHLILWKVYGGSMVTAFYFMQHKGTNTCKHGCKLTSRQFQLLKENNSKQKLGVNNPMYGKNPCSFMTEETIIARNRKISESKLGSKNPMSNPDSIKKMKQSKLGKDSHASMTKEQKQLRNKRISIAKKGVSCKKNFKKIICVETQEIFLSIQEAKNKYGIHNIGNCCQGKIKSAGKLNGKRLHWKFYKETI
jgi:hypothetical protein